MRGAWFVVLFIWPWTSFGYDPVYLKGCWRGTCAQGSGSVVRDASGRVFILTVDHVIQNFNLVDAWIGFRLMTIDLRRVKVEARQNSDAVLIPLSSNAGLKALPMRKGSGRGIVKAIGYPQGFPRSIKGPIVGELEIKGHGMLYTIRCNQDDFHGMSGGPVFDQDGYIIGAVDLDIAGALIGFSPI